MHNFAIIIINLSFLWYSKNFQLKIYLRLSFLARNLSQNHMRLLVKYKKKINVLFETFLCSLYGQCPNSWPGIQ
jgi:hypothetical protein